VSSTFDNMQQAIDWLESRAEDTGQVRDLIFYLRATIDALHGYSHKHGDELNRGRTAIEASRLPIILRHEDDEERRMYLAAAEKAGGWG
jgi:hypothetical protein